ncbi:protein of unknown function [Azospirillum baldaniorum]|uniref:Uncharacterized protein n=1 Tax=Azospirillum baldaniorum TaxID=1064539 RepID=A0A9P1JQ76_9PROT|nr:protein of unknown function [Azospirillum baldaniorum]
MRREFPGFTAGNSLSSNFFASFLFPDSRVGLLKRAKTVSRGIGVRVFPAACPSTLTSTGSGPIWRAKLGTIR